MPTYEIIPGTHAQEMMEESLFAHRRGGRHESVELHRVTLRLNPSGRAQS